MTALRISKEKRHRIQALKLEICKAIRREGPPVKPAVEKVIGRYKQQLPWAEKTVRGFFDRWMVSGCNPDLFDPYHGIRRDKDKLLKMYGLTTIGIKEWLKQKGETIKAWGERHGFKDYAVSNAINGLRVGLISRQILDILAREILSELGVRREATRALRIKLEDMIQRLKKIENQMH